MVDFDCNNDIFLFLKCGIIKLQYSEKKMALRKKIQSVSRQIFYKIDSRPAEHIFPAKHF